MVNFNLELCAETWKHLEIDKLGVQVYIRMFQMDPNMRQLFSFKDDVLEESMGLKRHSGILMRTIETSLASAENMEKFVPYLTSLAQRHAQYGLRPGYFNTLGKSLILTIEESLESKNKCTDEVKQAWESFWSTMESILTPALLHAINKPETMKGMYAAPVRSGSKGHVLGKSNDTRKKSTTQGAEIVLETWGIIEKDCDHYGAQVFLHFFKLRPDQLQLFSFKDESPLEESPGLKRHAGIFIRTLGQAVAGLENLTSMLPYLRSLAARHVQYGVTSELIETMGNAVFLAMEEGLGEKWSAEVQEAWALAWAAVESAMCDAIDQVRRGKGELPQLPVYDEQAEAAEEEKGSPLASLNQDFYKQVGKNKAKLPSEQQQGSVAAHKHLPPDRKSVV